MKMTVLIKLLPMFGLLVFALMKMPSFLSQAHKGQRTVAGMGTTIRGQVQEVLRDRRFLYLRVQTDNGLYWVATEQGEIENGSNVSCSLDQCIQAYSSTELPVAFETLYFSRWVDAEPSELGSV